MLIKDAKKIVGNLSQTTKMPCPSWSIPASLCKTGGLYSTMTNSVCSQCYAKKGRSNFSSVQNARQKRFDLWQQEDSIIWRTAMKTLIQRHSFFRWFDSGDIYNADMFMDICNICTHTCKTQHWLPTLERGLVLKHQHLIPVNLCIRFSSPIVNQISQSKFPISQVVTAPDPLTCKATTEKDRACGQCRRCWDKNDKLITYLNH